MTSNNNYYYPIYRPNTDTMPPYERAYLVYYTVYWVHMAHKNDLKKYYYDNTFS